MLCAHKDRTQIYDFEGIPIYRCNVCRLVFNDKYGKDFDPKEIYATFYRNEMSARFGFGIEYLIRLFRFFRAFKIFTIYPRASSILDIGSGRGYMLYYLKKYYGYVRTAGTQISKNAFEFSRHKLGLEIYDKDLLDLSVDDASFDIVTMWHVLEHVAHPEKYIEKISHILKDNGKIIVEVPNYNSWTRALTNRYWLGFDLDHHVTFFTPSSLSGLLEKYGFKIRVIHTFSLEYSTFLSVQSIVSRITRSDHLFFRFLQTGLFNIWAVIHGLLFLVLTVPCFFINIMLYFSKKGEVLLIVAEKG